MAGTDHRRRVGPDLIWDYGIETSSTYVMSSGSLGVMDMDRIGTITYDPATGTSSRFIRTTLPNGVVVEMMPDPPELQAHANRRIKEITKPQQWHEQI